MATAPKKLQEGGAIIADFDQLLETNPPPPCSCPNKEVRRCLWAFKMVDILQLARRFRDPVILAVEYRQQGSRIFMVTSRQHVFHYFCHLRIYRPQYQTWHEIFSGLTPLRLYFDLDFYYASNPQIDASRLLSIFRRLLLEILADYFRWRANEARNVRFVDLDATTGEKFSRHLIMHIPNLDEGGEITFKNPSELREFILESILPRLKSEGLLVRPRPGIRPQPTDQDDGNGPLIDLSVYSEKPGQNFRLLGSPKFGRDNVLRYLENPSFSQRRGHEFQFHDPLCQICEEKFLDSLVTASNSDSSIYSPDSDGQKELMSAEHFEIYRRNISWTSMNTKLFGIRCAFYFEAQDFTLQSILFHQRFAKDLLNDTVTAIRQIEFYEHLPTPGRLNQCVQLFRNFKIKMSRDPVDWDLIYGYTADILDFFRSVTEIDYDQLEDDELGNLPVEADPTSLRRLRILYAKFSKWRQENPGDFFRQDFDRAKKMYDQYLETLLASKKSIIPPDFPFVLTRRNFRGAYESLERLEHGELERRRVKKEKLEQRFLIKGEKLRRCLEEEEEYCRWMEETLERYRRDIVVTIQRGVELAICHSQELMKEYRKKIKIFEVGWQENGGAAANAAADVDAA